MAPSAPALFARYPGLAGRIPHRAFVALPSPVEAVPAEALPVEALSVEALSVEASPVDAKEAGGPPELAGRRLPEGRLYLKRDERSSPLYGGNKPRKLEFVIGRALARGAGRLVTTGATGTHHGLATTILGRAAGLPTTLVLMRQPVTPHVREQLRLIRAWGARVVDGGDTLPGTALRTLGVLARSAAGGERPELVPTGGSGAAGALGFLSAGLELDAQIHAGALPEPGSVVLPVGTGGTLAGLAAGLALAGRRVPVIGVLVTDVLPPSARRLRRSADRALARLARLDPSVPSRRLPREAFVLTRAQVGPGYGAPTPAGERALAAARAMGLALEPVYTAKALAELLARAERGRLPEGPVLFWNTANAVDPWAHAPGPEARTALPPALARLADEEEDGERSRPASRRRRRSARRRRAEARDEPPWAARRGRHASGDGG